MQLVIDANVTISALIADSKTRELIVTLEPDLLTPEVGHDELENYEALIIEKSEISADRTSQFIDLLFPPANSIPTSKRRTKRSVIPTPTTCYIACALACDAGVWSNDSDFNEQDLVSVYSTSDNIAEFDTR